MHSDQKMPRANTARDPGPLAEFRALYEEHFALAWRTLRRYGVPDSALDDAIQDAFSIAFAKLASFEGRSSLRTWIFGICRRVARDHRPSGRAELVGDAILVRLPEAEGRGPVASVERYEEAQVLDTLLAELRPERREIFVLVELEQLTIPEAAAALEENPNTLSTRLRAARKDLEQALARRRAQERWRHP